ncbi:lysoplasmalogenase [Cupriavidus necator]|uniref:lysoplasmalogenase n=1 Tax=Cupriavidus necator TaxID=106590 RepID=UPI00148F59CC|nr:lysoplasmalogenase [Cupriavidus necator]NOV25707.1 lysoplasmalogenase [Cupriavidus necator]
MSWLAMMMPARVREWWLAGTMAGLLYGALLVQVALDLPEGAPLTGHIAMQPVWKTAMALLLARAAWFHRVPGERRWLVTALLCSALGDFLLALPALSFSFMGGLGAFLLAHLAYLRLLVPLAGDTRPHRLIACGAMLGVAGTMLGRFWPNLGTLTVPVALYVGVLAAMVCGALVARLPTPLAALGALCFAASDMMIGIARFLVPFESFQLGIWWTYAAAQVLLVAGLVSGRARP